MVLHRETADNAEMVLHDVQGPVKGTAALPVIKAFYNNKKWYVNWWIDEQNFGFTEGTDNWANTIVDFIRAVGAVEKIKKEV